MSEVGGGIDGAPATGHGQGTEMGTDSHVHEMHEMCRHDQQLQLIWSCMRASTNSVSDPFGVARAAAVGM